MPHALALIAAAVSTAALLVVVSLTVFVVSLALRAKTPESRRGTRHLGDVDGRASLEPTARKPGTLQALAQVRIAWAGGRAAR